LFEIMFEQFLLAGDRPGKHKPAVSTLHDLMIDLSSIRFLLRTFADGAIPIEIAGSAPHVEFSGTGNELNETDWRNRRNP
jgi:hypothetical protein